MRRDRLIRLPGVRIFALRLRAFDDTNVRLRRKVATLVPEVVPKHGNARTRADRKISTGTSRAPSIARQIEADTAHGI